MRLTCFLYWRIYTFLEDVLKIKAIQLNTLLVGWAMLGAVHGSEENCQMTNSSAWDGCWEVEGFASGKPGMDFSSPDLSQHILFWHFLGTFANDVTLPMQLFPLFSEFLGELSYLSLPHPLPPLQAPPNLDVSPSPPGLIKRLEFKLWPHLPASPLHTLYKLLVSSTGCPKPWQPPDSHVLKSKQSRKALVIKWGWK